MHKIHECNKFLKIPVDDRSKAVFEAGRCFRCLVGKGHSSRDCPKKQIIFCKVSDYRRQKHHTLLHGAKFVRPPVTLTLASVTSTAAPALASSATAPTAETPFVDTALCQEAPRQRRMMLGIVPVCVSFGTRKFNTFAFLDPRAIATLIITNREESIKFRAYDVYAVDDIQMSSNVPLNQLPIHKWKHVNGLEFADVLSSQITVVIANDLDEAHDRLETRRPPDGSFRPSAHRTHFGWMLSGRMIPPGITEPRMSAQPTTTPPVGLG